MAPSTAELNKAVLRVYIDAIANTGDTSTIERYVAADFREHYGPPGLPAGIRAAIALVRMFSDNFAGYRFEVEEMFAEGDWVLVRGWGNGRHTGTFLGIPAPGREIRFRAAHVFQVVDGKLAACWAYPDTLGLLQQLGGVPSPGPA